MTKGDCPRDPSLPALIELRAAAVCYRPTAQGVEFLLVRTKGWPAWTFPKGHLQAGETPARAARREAKEEAAAFGRIEAQAFTRYRRRAWRPLGLPIEVCVESFLMEVESEGPRGSAERWTAWFPAEEAAARLAENQEPAYAREHRRVIKEAMATLRRRLAADG